jgi:hypothetical protein
MRTFLPATLLTGALLCAASFAQNAPSAQVPRSSHRRNLPRRHQRSQKRNPSPKQLRRRLRLPPPLPPPLPPAQIRHRPRVYTELPPEA